MTTPPLPRPVAPPESGPHPSAGSTGTSRFVLVLLTLIWPAQLLTATGVATGMTTAGVAQAFATTQVVWFGLAYTLVATLLTPVMARLGDVFGKKRVMLAIAAIGLLGDLLVVLAPSFPLVVAGRALAGFYGPIAALIFATARDIFPPKRVGLASSLIGSSLGLTTLITPLVAGVLLDNFTFRGPLWFVVAGTAIAIVLLTTLPETPRRAASARFDVVGAVLLGVASAALVYGVAQGPAWGWTSSRVLGLFAGTVIAVVVFVLVESRHPEPMVDMRMLKRRNVATVLAATSLLQGTVYSIALVITLLTLFPPIPGISAGLGWTGTKTALVTSAGQLLLFLLGFLVGKMSGRWDPRRPWLVGSVTIVLGLVCYALLHGNEWQIAVSALVFGLGGGFSVGAVPLLILGSVSPAEQGMASGMSVLLTGLVNAVTSAIIFAVLAASGVVAQGTQFYSDTSFRNAYLVAAGIVLVSLVVSLAIPRVLTTSEIRSGDAVA